ncbi:hypothetical protein E1B28_003904 [Marasmius oreades]|nr:uncharacterized protein E1B28_003904 [Marasmius oreades]KAG7096472.1 hypothetical protein E1B28_003904 [Marasmius oreades]
MLVQSAMDSRRDVLGDPSFTLAVFAQHKRPEFWKPRPWQTIPHRQEPSLIFPEGDHLRDLVNLFFTSVNPLFPLLHRPTFERSIAEGLHIQNRSFGATVLAVCAVGARQSDDPRDLYEGTTSEHGLGWKWFSQIPLMRESLTDPPSLYDLQRCSLSVLYLQATSTPEAAWTVVGIGIRSAQEMGVHRKPVPSGNSLEDELWKRAFWLLVSIDLFFSAFMGRPRATTHDDFDVDLPVECDDEYWENPDPEKAFVQPVGKPSVVSFFVALLRLLDIVSFAQSTLYSVRKSELWYGMGIFGIDWKRRAVLELDSALNKYVDTIPEHLKWDPDNPDPVFFQQSATLYAIYHWVQIQIHRPFIPRPGQEPILPFPSLEICCNAARKTIHIIERLHARMDKAMAVLESVTFIVSPLFTSTLILLLSIWRPKSGSESTSESSKGMEVVYRSMKLIQKYESRNSYAGRVGDILSAVITVGQLPRTKNRKSPQSSGEGADQNSVPSHAQVVVADLHDTFHNTAQTSSHNLSTISDATSSLSQPASFPSAHDGCGIFGPPQIQTDFFMHDMAPADISLFDVNFTGSQLMLQPPNQAVANPMWNAQPMLTENVAFSQEDWDSFMVSVNDIVTEAVEYRGY